MDVYFAGGLEGGCRTREAREESWGAAASIVGRRLFELASLARLSDLASLPGVRVRNDASGERYELICVYGVRIMLAPVDGRGAVLKSHSDPMRVTAVRIEQLEFDAEEGA